jgi:hypothetical protein
MRHLCWTLVVALALSVLPASSMAQDGETGSELDKPLAQFTVGDIFPRITDPSTRSIGDSWVSSAADLARLAQDRLVAVDQAIEGKNAHIERTKAELKNARRDKDFVREGTLEGTLEHDRTVVRILEDLQEVSATQIDFANAWAEAGKAINEFVSADEAFDAVRTRGIAKPAANAIDERMGSIQVELLRDHAAAMDRLGERFEELGEVTQKSAERRLDLLKRLERGGHVRMGP